MRRGPGVSCDGMIPMNTLRALDSQCYFSLASLLSSHVCSRRSSWVCSRLYFVGREWLLFGLHLALFQSWIGDILQFLEAAELWIAGHAHEGKGRLDLCLALLGTVAWNTAILNNTQHMAARHEASLIRHSAPHCAEAEAELTPCLFFARGLTPHGRASRTTAEALLEAAQLSLGGYSDAMIHIEEK